jgi:cell division protein FtsI/penicillin-binding protein 2
MRGKENPDFVIDAFVIRVGVLALAAFLLFSVLVIRLWNMQVVGSSEYEYKDRKQSARRIRIPAMRGEIFGRDGTAIVRNRPSYNVLFHPGEMTTERSRDRAQFIMDQADQVTLYDKAFTALSYPMEKTTSPVYGISEYAIVNLATGETVADGYTAVKEQNVAAGLWLIGIEAPERM